LGSQTGVYCGGKTNGRPRFVIRLIVGGEYGFTSQSCKNALEAQVGKVVQRDRGLVNHTRAFDITGESGKSIYTY